MLVGASGSGKSTLGKLICGLYRPWAGEIRIDGWRLPEIPPQVFANSITYVDQDIFLFEGTARELMRLQYNARIHPMGDLTFNPVARPGDPDWRVMYIAAGDGGSGEQKTKIREALAQIKSM